MRGRNGKGETVNHSKGPLGGEIGGLWGEVARTNEQGLNAGAGDKRKRNNQPNHYCWKLPVIKKDGMGWSRKEENLGVNKQTRTIVFREYARYGMNRGGNFSS